MTTNIYIYIHKKWLINTSTTNKTTNYGLPKLNTHVFFRHAVLFLHQGIHFKVQLQLSKNWNIQMPKNKRNKLTNQRRGQTSVPLFAFLSSPCISFILYRSPCLLLPTYLLFFSPSLSVPFYLYVLFQFSLFIFFFYFYF